MLRMIKNLLPACYLLVISMFFSCVAPIDINTRDSEPVIVIYGCLTDELTNQYIRITRSSPYFHDETNPAVTGAKVSVTSSAGREYTFLSDKDGYYYSQRRFSVVPGTTYRLSVEVDGEFYQAETTTFPIVPADSIDINLLDIMGFNHYSLNIYMQEPYEAANFYLFKFIINDSISNDRVSEFIISDDIMFNGEYMNGASVFLFEDATDPDLQELNKNNDIDFGYWVSPGDRIRLQILNIEKGYFKFIQECMNEKHGENPFFGGPPSNITTNLSNGAIGYFSSFCIQEKEAVFP